MPLGTYIWHFGAVAPLAKTGREGIDSRTLDVTVLLAFPEPGWIVAAFSSAAAFVHIVIVTVHQLLRGMHSPGYGGEAGQGRARANRS